MKRRTNVVMSLESHRDLMRSESQRTEIYQKFNLKTDDDNDNDNANNNANKRRGSALRLTIRDRLMGAAPDKQGRLYSTKYANQPGGIRLEDMIFGVKMAQMSCIDDSNPQALKYLGPTTKEMLKAIVDPRNKRTHHIKQQQSTNNSNGRGKKNPYSSEELQQEYEQMDLDAEIQKPLSQLLREHFNLNMDCWIDESGFRYGRAVDVQAFIASSIRQSDDDKDDNNDNDNNNSNNNCSNDDNDNDNNSDSNKGNSNSEGPSLPQFNNSNKDQDDDGDDDDQDIIVLSYRFTLNIRDWMTNLDMTSSKWDIASAERIGHAGCCSCWTESLRRNVPRVHTGYYNNFVRTIPMIRKHIIEPLMREQEKANPKPKKVYVCGSSLGAGLATLAFAFLIQELPLENPLFPSHKIICVTAGSPRVGNKRFRELFVDRLQRLRQLDRAVSCRLVYNHDLVPHVPFHLSSFRHVDKLVYITYDGDVIINPNLEHNQNFDEIKALLKKSFWDAQTEAVSSRVAKRFSRIDSIVMRNAVGVQTAFRAKLAGISEGDEEKGDGDSVSVSEISGSGEGGGEVEVEAALNKEDNDTDKVNHDENSNRNSDTKTKTTKDDKPHVHFETDEDMKNNKAKAAYEVEWEKTPGPLRDHMPYWYLICLEQLKRKLDREEAK